MKEIMSFLLVDEKGNVTHRYEHEWEAKYARDTIWRVTRHKLTMFKEKSGLDSIGVSFKKDKEE